MSKVHLSISFVAECAYNSYNDSGEEVTRWKSWDGKHVPKWDDLPLNVRIKWMGAVYNIFEMMNQSESLLIP